LTRSPGVWLATLLSICAVGCAPEPRDDRPPAAPAKPPAAVAAGTESQRAAAAALDRAAGGDGAPAAKQILFGDLHVHSTFSFDAYLFSLPIFGGEGARPPADACDFARYCANLDFYAITDHAESLRAEHWALTKQAVRECNARAGDPASPDLVAFTGFEWSQMGTTPDTHFGHRCLVFPDDAEDALPPRPIAAGDRRQQYLGTARTMQGLRWFDLPNFLRYGEYVDYAQAILAEPICDDAVPFAERGACMEVAETPAALHGKLDEWGGEVLEIPHGTAWGVYTPATTSIARHLDPAHFDPARQPLVELMSGHGSSEEYRRWVEWEVAADGERICPEPTADYLPCCWQAGEIMRARCGDLPADECERRVELARQYATEAFTRPVRVFPDAAPEEWLDCGQCRDCFKPAYGYRPKESIQYALALSRDDARAADGRPLRFRYGFVGSSDEHSARPGVGYKAVDRGLMTDVNQVQSDAVVELMTRMGAMEDPRMPVRPQASMSGVSGNDGRVQSFLFPGGLAAVHARSRSREDLWSAMQRREVYATSGPRILLWFDLVNGPEGGRQPMGSEVYLAAAPEFEVRAVGSFEPLPGCPDWTREGLSAEQIQSMCHGECHHPGERRRPIVAIEVVRIRPQRHAGEPVDELIEDPWRRFECPGDPEGCVVHFRDDESGGALARDSVYYVRALEEARPAILGDPLRPTRDADGRTTAIAMCETGDDCLDPVQERAWSSPIFVNRL